MKKTILIFILTGLIVKTFAQEYQVIDTTKYVCTYNYEFLEDSTSMSSLTQTEMYLQIGSHLSKFTNSSTFISDSIFFLNENINDPSLELQVFKLVAGTRPKILAMYSIYKNWPKKDIVSFTAYDDHKYYQVVQPLSLKWKLEVTKDSIITGYHCKKALTTFAGRKYIAWYTMQIPVNDGPYKFRGLPGLIVKISDSQNQHQFMLTSVKKLKYIQPIFFSKQNYIEITPQEYVNVLKSKLNRLFGKVQSGDITLSTDEGKAKSLQGLKARNNFIEKY